MKLLLQIWIHSIMLLWPWGLSSYNIYMTKIFQEVALVFIRKYFFVSTNLANVFDRASPLNSTTLKSHPDLSIFLHLVGVTLLLPGQKKLFPRVPLSQPWTTDAQWGNSLHCTAENSLPLPNFRYDQSIFCLPHRPNFSDIFDLCLRWVSVVRVSTQ